MRVDSSLGFFSYYPIGFFTFVCPLNAIEPFDLPILTICCRSAILPNIVIYRLNINFWLKFRRARLCVFHYFIPWFIFGWIVLVAMSIRCFDLIEININRLNPGVRREHQYVIVKIALFRHREWWCRVFIFTIRNWRDEYYSLVY